MDRILNSKAIAEEIGIAPSTLRKIKCLQGKGRPTPGYATLPFRKRNGRLVMLESDLRRWAGDHRDSISASSKVTDGNDAKG